MKKLIVFIVSVFIIFIFNTEVYAKDTVYSINKYKEENLKIVKDSYSKENKVDGIITTGTITKEDKKVIIVKYNSKGNVLWKYIYGKTEEDDVDDLIYTYDENNKINGYAIVMKTTKEIGELLEPSMKNTTFIKFDLEGNLVEEKNSTLSENSFIKKLIETKDEELNVNGYIGIGNNNAKSFIAKFDKNLNLIVEKQIEEDNNFIDIAKINENGKEIAYAITTKVKENEINKTKVLRINKELNIENVIVEKDYEKDNLQLLEIENGIIIYGITDEVKLTKYDSTSYYILNYDINNELVWDTIGNALVNENNKIKLIRDNDKYLLMYSTKKNNGIEVIRIDEEGLVQEKIKKIINDYYKIEDFLYKEDTLYFIGQIKCPNDDTCVYDNNSLLLISDKEKVIEVEDDHVKAVSWYLIPVMLIVIYMIYKKRKKSN